MALKILTSDFEEKLSKVSKDNFCVIADYNKTFTKSSHNGIRTLSSYEFFRTGDFLFPGYNTEAQKNFDTYHPYESDDVDSNIRDSKLSEWWDKHHMLMIQNGLRKEHFERIVSDYSIPLRDNLKEFLELLQSNRIPLLIFSSGLGNLIDEQLYQNNLIFNNIQLISNIFGFSEKGIAISRSTPPIHPYNKGTVDYGEVSYISDKSVCLILGDEAQDFAVENQFEFETVIKVGFYNGKEESQKKLDLVCDAVFDDTQDSFGELISLLENCF